MLAAEALRTDAPSAIVGRTVTEPVRDAAPIPGPGAIDDLVTALERDQARAMFGFVRRLGLSPEQAEDAVQDVLLRLWTALDAGAVVERPVAWCFTSLYRRAMDEHRLRKRLERIRERFVARPRPLEADPAAQSESIWLVVDRLPPRQRQVLYLRYRADLTFDEIARVLHISAGAARATGSNAIAALRRSVPEDEL